MLSERTWSAEAVVRLLLGLFVIFATVQLGWAAVENFGVAPPLADQKLVRMILGTVSFQLAALGLIALFLREQRLTWSSAFGFKSPRLSRAIALGLLAGVLVVPAAWTLQHLSAQFMEWLQWTPQSQEVVRNFQESLTQSEKSAALLRQHIVFGISVIVIAPVAEEMLFRGVIYTTFKQLGYPRLSLWGTSLVFAALHSNLPSFLPFLLLALLLVYLYEATDNLLAPIVTHSFFNTANFVLMLYQEPITRLIYGLP